MSIDPADKLKTLRENKGLTYPLLMDPGSRTIKRYGILNEDHGKIPHPTALVIDKEGIVRFMRVDVDYKTRPSTEDLLDVLRTLQG